MEVFLHSQTSRHHSDISPIARRTKVDIDIGSRALMRDLRFRRTVKGTVVGIPKPDPSMHRRRMHCQGRTIYSVQRPSRKPLQPTGWIAPVNETRVEYVNSWSPMSSSRSTPELCWSPGMPSPGMADQVSVVAMEEADELFRQFIDLEQCSDGC